VIHVHKDIERSWMGYVMGPKPVFGEYVDGQLAASAPPPGNTHSCRQIMMGALRSPAVDDDYNITRYRFAESGRHQTHRQIGKLRSNGDCSKWCAINNLRTAYA